MESVNVDEGRQLLAAAWAAEAPDADIDAFHRWCDLNLSNILDEVAQKRQLEECVADLIELIQAIGLVGKPRQFKKPCFCDTLSGLYCVGDLKCTAINAAIDKAASLQKGKDNGKAT